MDTKEIWFQTIFFRKNMLWKVEKPYGEKAAKDRDTNF